MKSFSTAHVQTETTSPKLDLQAQEVLAKGRVLCGDADKILLFLQMEPGYVSYIELEADGSNRVCTIIDPLYEDRQASFQARDKISEIPWAMLEPINQK